MSAPGTFGLAANLALFAVAAAAVWIAGTRISAYASIISEKTGIGNAVMGLLLLGGITSLPEFAVTASASWQGNIDLAVNNIFGGVAMQVAILVLADFLIGRRALTAVVPEPIVMLQGTLMILMLAIAAAGLVVGDVPFLGAGLWTWGILLFYVYCIWSLSRDPDRRPWIATRAGRVDEPLIESEDAQAAAQERGLPATIARAGGAGAVILVAGYLLSVTGEGIAEQTGMGSSFAGFVLVAISTSLPEVSTVFGAARLGLYTMAISDIFGTNLFDIALLFVVDAIAGGAAALNQGGAFSVFGALLGIAITGLYVAGLAERRDRAVLRLGVDSLAVLVVYLGGLGILFSLR